jgi:hypothetical protein
MFHILMRAGFLMEKREQRGDGLFNVHLDGFMQTS